MPVEKEEEEEDEEDEAPRFIIVTNEHVNWGWVDDK